MRTFGEKDTQVVVETVGREVPLAHVGLDAVEHLSARGATAMPTSVWDAGLARGAVFDQFEELGMVLDRGRRGVLEVEGDAVPSGKDAGEVFVNRFGGEGWFPVGSDGFAFVVGGFGEGAVWTLNGNADSLAFEWVPETEQASALGVAAPFRLGG